MATINVSHNDVQALAERLNNRSKSAILDQMPETPKDMKLAAAFLSYVAALGLPMGMISLTIDNGL
jgi:hypothetical protein